METNTKVPNSSSVTSTGGESTSPEARGLRKNVKLMITAGGALFLMLIVGLVVVKLLGGSKSSQIALPPKVEMPENVLLATVGDKQIMRDDVVKIALEQISPDAIDGKILKDFLLIAIERKLLDEKIQELSLEIPRNGAEFQYYESLKTEVKSKLLSTRTANSIGYWLPEFASEYPQKPEYEGIRSVNEEIIKLVSAQLQQGVSPYQIAENVSTQYPQVKDLLGVNGYRYAKLTDLSLVESPVSYTYDTNPDTSQFINALFSLNEGEVEGFNWEDGSGITVIQLVELSQGEQISYEQWLEEEISNRVEFNEQNVSKL